MPLARPLGLRPPFGANRGQRRPTLLRLCLLQGARAVLRQVRARAHIEGLAFFRTRKALRVRCHVAGWPQRKAKQKRGRLCAPIEAAATEAAEEAGAGGQQRRVRRPAASSAQPCAEQHLPATATAKANGVRPQMPAVTASLGARSGAPRSDARASPAEAVARLVILEICGAASEPDAGRPRVRQQPRKRRRQVPPMARPAGAAPICRVGPRSYYNSTMK